MSTMRFCCFVCMLVSLAIPLELRAHEPGQSYTFLTVNDRQIEGRFEITIADLNQALNIGLSTAGTLTLDQVEPFRDMLLEYYGARVVMEHNGIPVTLIWEKIDVTETRFAQYLRLHFSLPEFEQSPESLDVTYRVLFDQNAEHRAFLVVENNWKTGTFNEEVNILLVFSPDRTRATLDLSDGTTARGFSEMVKLGTHHIWEGIDHVLFLIALLLPSVLRREQGKWQATPDFRTALFQVIKIVTVFTVAHTITLSTAALGAVSLPSRLVESIIAISIAIAALDVLFPVFRGRIWWVVFAFGLFHGFGFASVLGELEIPSNYMLHSLLGFNLGVELGQVVIVTMAFPVLYLLRNVWVYREVAIRAGATVLIVVSLYWFIERGFEVDLPAGEYTNKVLGAMGMAI